MRDRLTILVSMLAAGSVTVFATIFTLLMIYIRKIKPLPENTAGSTSMAPKKEPKRVFGYTIQQFLNGMTAFEINKETGELTQIQQISGSGFALPIVCSASKDGTHIFVANYSNNTISSITINLETGLMTITQNLAVPVSGFDAIAVHPSKRIVYGANYSTTNKIVVIDYDVNGMMTVRGTISITSAVAWMAVDNAGKYMYTANQDAKQVMSFALDDNGDVVLYDTLQLDTNFTPAALTISRDERFLFLGSWNDGRVASVRVNNGKLTLVDTATTGSSQIFNMVNSPKGDRVYAFKPYANKMETIGFNPNTGELDTSSTSITYPGAVSASFWRGFAFLMGWDNNRSDAPIETRVYEQDITANALFKTIPYKGVYSMTIVETF